MNDKKENLSLWQLFILIFLSTMGSSVVVNLGAEAKNSAWISILIACLAGLVLVFIYFQLLKWYPNKHLFEIICLCLGKWGGRIVGILYISYFFLLASFVLRDFGELMVATIFSKTPLEFFHLTLMLLVFYILHQGIEVLGRSSEIFIPYGLLFIVFLGFGIALSGQFHFENLFPIMGDGIMQVIKPAFIEIINFPFGEIIIFMTIIPTVKLTKYAYKTSIAAYVFSGLVLAYSSILQTVTLGPIKERTLFPLLSAARFISLLNFIERVDLLIVFIMMLGIVVKISVFFYGGLKGLEYIFNIPYRSFGFSMAMIVSLFSISIGEDYPSYITFGTKYLTLYLQNLFQILIPILLLTIAFIKKKWSGKQNESI